MAKKMGKRDIKKRVNVITDGIEKGVKKLVKEVKDKV